jgi:tetratricopeptide (TPR) repeat protein
MNGLRCIIVGIAATLAAFANSHREAPTALDRAAAITDFYAFVSDNDPSKVAFVLKVDSAFDPTLVYTIRADTQCFEFRFLTEIGSKGAMRTYSMSGQKAAFGQILKLANGVRAWAGATQIAIEAPAAMFPPVIETWAATYRARTTVRRGAEPSGAAEIQRMGNPVADAPEPLRLDTRLRAGFPNGRRLTDDVMAISLGAPPTAPRKAAQPFPYVMSAASKPAPHGPETQTALAAGYMQKLRETGDGGYLDRAAKILDAVLANDGRNYEALRLRNAIALQLHEFPRVVEESRKLAASQPQDPRNFGTLGDALMEMGEYDKAADAYQKMVDLRPGLSSLNRVAFYRFVTGDAEGAIAVMNDAIAAGSDVPENLAWCLVDLGWMYFKIGKVDDAAAAFANALRVFPGYHRAHAGLGQTLAAQGRVAAAIEQYRAAQAVVPMPDYAAALAELYGIERMDGEKIKQQALLDLLDQLGRAKGEITNRNLAVVYADQDRKLDRALQLAQAELNSRKDVYTYDALAWALYKNGKPAEAADASARALAMKTAEPVFYFHAGMIAAAAGKAAEARAFLERALELNPKFDPLQAQAAQKTLTGLARQAAVHPPSMENTAPCTNCASSDAR